MKGCTGRLVARGEERIGSTTPMPMSAGRPSTKDFSYQRKFHRIQWLCSKDCKYRSFSSTNSRTFNVLMLEDKVQNPSLCSDFPSEAMLSRSIEGKDFPNFEMLDARIASALNKIIQNSYFKKEVSLEEQKAQKEDRFLRGKNIAFMMYDYFRVTGAHNTVLDYADLFSITLRNDGQWDGVPKACHQQAAADPRGSEPACVQTPFELGVAHAWEHGPINVLPWYRLVCVVLYLQTHQRRREETGLPCKGKWSPRGSVTTAMLERSRP